MDLEKYRTLFVDETTDHLAEMSRALAAVERGDEDASDEGAIDTLFRMAHSIKGMAASLDYDAVSALAHRLEDWLEPVRSSGAMPEDGVQLVYEIIGALESMVAVVGADEKLSAGSGTAEHRDDDRGALYVQTTLELSIYLFAHGCRDAREPFTSRAVR